jgi:hypothetical protein
MTTSLFIPLEGGFHHGHDFVGGAPPVFPFLGASMGLLCSCFCSAPRSSWYVGASSGHRRGWRRVPAEADARRILADRFARGEISSDEFMSASILNWTPGSDTWETASRTRQR